MYKNLPSGIKISISRSITTAFEHYMASIGWEEDRFDMNDFIFFWRAYSEEQGTWFAKIDPEVKEDAGFHEAIAKKINETIEKIVSEPVSEDLAASIEIKQEKLGTSYQYGCKAEAQYIDHLLKEMEK